MVSQDTVRTRALIVKLPSNISTVTCVSTTIVELLSNIKVP